MVQAGGTKHKLTANKGHLKRATLAAEHVEFLCVSCHKESRVERSKKNLCIKQMKNGAYLLQSQIDCKICKKTRKVARFVSKIFGEKLIRDGTVKCKK
jgi:cytochrome c553